MWGCTSMELQPQVLVLGCGALAVPLVWSLESRSRMLSSPWLLCREYVRAPGSSAHLGGRGSQCGSEHTHSVLAGLGTTLKEAAGSGRAVSDLGD